MQLLEQERLLEQKKREEVVSTSINCEMCKKTFSDLSSLHFLDVR